MMLPDVNVLLGAFRTDSPVHAPCKRWLDSVIVGDAPYAISPQVLSSVIRITTNRRAFPDPDPVEDAMAFCEAVMAPPNCHVILPGTRHWKIFRDLCLEVGVKGPLVSDAWFAALAIEHGCEWVTLDRDFARFQKLRWRTPF